MKYDTFFNEVSKEYMNNQQTQSDGQWQFSLFSNLNNILVGGV